MTSPDGPVSKPRRRTGAPRGEAASVEDLVELVGQMSALRAHVEELEQRAVLLARAGGARWLDIGDRLGITEQAARGRYWQPRPRRRAKDI